jgi:hypothetical protein
MPALKQRMTDTNKMLTLQAVQLLGKLATAMGRPIAREDRGCLAAAIRCLTDPKPMVGWLQGMRGGGRGRPTSSWGHQQCQSGACHSQIRARRVCCHTCSQQTMPPSTKQDLPSHRVLHHRLS